MFFIVL